MADHAVEKVEHTEDEGVLHDQAEHPVHHGDKTVIFGKTYDIPIYTAVFMALGAFTILEVLIAEIMTGEIKIALLLGLAVAKAALVVLFYMHLSTDSRLFALALIVPLAIATISLLFLLGVPLGDYGAGY